MKGIKADCNHLMRTTYPDARVGVVDSDNNIKALEHSKAQMENGQHSIRELHTIKEK